MAEDGSGFTTFMEAYFDFLEKGILVYKDGTVLETVGLETGEGSVIQEEGTYSPSPVVTTKFVLERNSSTDIAQTGSFEPGEYVVGNTSGSTARIDVIGNNNSKLYIELFTEAHFLPDETVVGQNSGYTAKVDNFKGNALMAANNLLSYADVDKTTGSFLDFFREDFMPSIDSTVLADKRILAKHINEIYSTKGNLASYSFLFRILYGEDITIAYPRDNVITSSNSGWSETELIHLYSTKNLLDYPLGRVIKRNTASEIVTDIQVDKMTGVDSGEGTNVYAIRIETPFIGTLSIGDEVEVQSRENPAKFHLATVRGVVGDIDTSEGSLYIKQESGTDVIASESDNTEGFLLESGSQSSNRTDNILLLEEGTQSNNTINEVHGKTPIMVRETVNTVNTEAVVGGGMYTEDVDKGSLYSVSDQVTINLPSSELGVGLRSKALVGSIEDGSLDQIIVDPSNRGVGYSNGDLIVFDNRDTGGTLAYGHITSTSGNVMLEAGTTFGALEYVATAGQVIFDGVDRHNHMMVYDPEKVQVFVKRSDQTDSNNGEVFSYFEEVTGQNNIILTGTKVTFTGTYAQSGHANYVGGAGTVVHIYAQPDETNLTLEDGGALIYDQSGADPTGAIAKATIFSGGVGYTSLPKAYVGGEIFYTETATTPDFLVGESLVNAGGGTIWGTILDHDVEVRKLVVAKESTSSVNTQPSVGDTIKVVRSTGDITAIVKNSNLTLGTSAQVMSFGKDIGTIGKLRVQEEGNHFNKSGGIPDYPHKMIISAPSSSLVVATTVTGAFSGATGTIKSYDGDRHLLTLTGVVGMFKEGEIVTTSDNKTYTVLRSNPATARATNVVVAKLDGNYTDDKGFPSVTSQRIHDSHYYQDFSYVIKVGESINKYRSIVKQLLNPAGTIFFGEVAVTANIDSRADIYNANFDGTKTTRSFIPILYIGSKIDPVKIILEDATIDGSAEDTFYGTSDNLVLENGEGIITSERFLVNDRMKLTLELDSMSPAGARDFTIGETVYQNQFKTESGDLSTLKMKVVDRERDGSGNLIADPSFIIVENLITDNTAIKQYLSEDPVNHLYLDGSYNHYSGWGLPVPSKEAWQSNQTSENALHLPWGIVGESSGKKAEVNSVVAENTKTDQGSGQGFIAGTDVVESDVGLYDRIIRANVQAGGHKVYKHLDIMPHYAHHRLYYTTLDNALSIGTYVTGGTTNVTGRVMEHNTTSKYFVLYTGDDKTRGQAGLFTTEAIKVGSTTHFTATKVESHYPFEEDPIERVQTSEPTAVSGATASEGGGQTFLHANVIGGFHGRGKTLSTAEGNEFYDTATKQRTKNVIVTQTFASANTKSGRTLLPVPSSKEDTNQQGLRGQSAFTTLLRTGGLEWGETIKSAGRDSIINNHNVDSFRSVSDNSNWNSYDHHGLQSGIGHLPIPSDAKRINSVIIGKEETLIAENGDRLVMEPDQGYLMIEPQPEQYNSTITTDGKQYWGNGWTVDPTEELTMEDGSKIHLEDATEAEVVGVFVTERTPNFASMFINHEDHGRIIYEDGSSLVQEEAESVVGVEHQGLGTTLGDLSKIGFSSTLQFEERIRQESGNAASYTGGINTESGKGDNILMEHVAGRLLEEAPYNGVSISDISNLYGSLPISELDKMSGIQTNLTFSASIQSGA